MDNSQKYSAIQHKLDKLIGRFGSDKVVEILGHYESVEENYLLIINKFIRFNIAGLYHCRSEEQLDGTDHVYSEARNIIYHLLHKEVDMSIRQICMMYGKNPPSVHGGMKDIDGILHDGNPKHHKVLIDNYNCVKNKLTVFKELLNTYKKDNYGKE